MTASTRTGTLSRVITSWGGTFNVTVRSEIRTMRSIAGTSSTRPGPFVAITRPSRNTTARSYSRSTRTDAAASPRTTAKTKITVTSAASIMVPPPIPRPGAR